VCGAIGGGPGIVIKTRLKLGGNLKIMLNLVKYSIFLKKIEKNGKSKKAQEWNLERWKKFGKFEKTSIIY